MKPPFLLSPEDTAAALWWAFVGCFGSGALTGWLAAVVWHGWAP